MSFHEIVFSPKLSFGSSGGPERQTEIVTLASGFEERNTIWAHSRRRYDAGLGVRTLDDLHEVISFFEARRGMLFGFRWKDWSDFRSCKHSGTLTAFDQVLGEGDGETKVFQLSRGYVSGSYAYRRPILKPVENSVMIGKDGEEAVPGADYLVDHQSGRVTFETAPEPGAALTAGFEFHVPVRFDTDRIEINLASFEAGEIPSVPIIEVRL